MSKMLEGRADGRIVTKILYLGANPLHTGLYANVIGQMVKAGFDVDLVINHLIDFRNPFANLIERKQVTENIIHPSRSLIKGKVYGPIPFHYRAKALYIIALQPIILRTISRGNILLLHARTLHVADAALTLKRLYSSIRVISELEGDVESELHYSIARGSSPIKGDIRKRLGLHSAATQRVIKHSDAVLCVSNKLKEVLVDRFQLSKRSSEKLVVFPTFVSREVFFFDTGKRSRQRRDWGIENRFVVIYAGNLSTPWQLPKETVEVFCLIKQIRKDALLLVIAPDFEHKFILPYLRDADLSPDDYQLRYVAYKDMPCCLSAADLGLILRERHLMNEVASPGKIVEYLMSGLPVIMTESVGEYADQLDGHFQVFVLPDIEKGFVKKEVIRNFVTMDVTANQRKAFSAWAMERFSIEVKSPLLERTYREIIHE